MLPLVGDTVLVTVGGSVEYPELRPALVTSTAWGVNLRVFLEPGDDGPEFIRNAPRGDRVGQYRTLADMGR